ncbi:hypothetical protein [Pseudomonas sp. HLT2-19-2]
MTNLNTPEEVQHQVEGTIAEISEAKTELEAEKAAAHAKGYISALRYSNLIEHALFDPLDTGLDEALREWHRKHGKLD